MKYEVLTYGREELRRKAVPVPRPDARIRQLARDMLEAMYRANGVGLAAQQIGREEAVCVIDIRPALRKAEAPPSEADAVAMPLVMLNPCLVATAGEASAEEGCLSFPDLYVTMRRPRDVTVTYLALDGTTQTVVATGLLARAIQHELDHLNGILLVDRMSIVQRVAVAGKLKRLKQQTAEAVPA